MSAWPKQLPVLTPEQERIRDDFMKHWHEVLPARYGAIESFNHRYPLREWKGAAKENPRVLEIGAGLGEHILYEDLTGVDYYALELREEMAARIRDRFPQVKTAVGDIQRHLDFPDRHFQRIIAIHVLEHLPNLPLALKEIHRLLSPSGRFDVVIPCEGGLAYTMARRISAQRIFEKRYNMSYDWFVKSEHVNRPHEILAELGHYFQLDHSRYFPFILPSIAMNLVIGLRLSPLQKEK
jgi:SAM-dependent methyltransferase